MPLLRRWALLLVASALAAGPAVCAAPALADQPVTGCTSGGCIHITYPGTGHPAVDIPASVLDPQSGNDDIVTKQYQLDYPNGDKPTEIVTGVSLNKLLTSLVPADEGLDKLGTVTYAELTNPGSSRNYRSFLREGELGPTPTPFLDDTAQPVFALSGTDDVEYVRPQRTADDVNGLDRVQTAPLSNTIDLAVHTSGAVVTPTITVLKGPRKVGSTVHFVASLGPDDPPTSEASLSWTFATGDPAQTAPAMTQYRYTYADTFTVSVRATGDDADIGAFSGGTSVTVTIGTRTPPKPRHGHHGGDGNGGKTHPTSGPTKGRGHHEGSAPTGGPTLAPTASGQPTATSGPTGAGAASSAVPGSSTSHPRSSHDPGTAQGAFVQGILIGPSSAPVAGSARTSDAVPAAASARRPARVSSSFDARWLWVLAPVLLLVAGALGERRRVPGRHGPQSRT